MRIKLRICIGLAVALTSTVCMGSVRYLPGNVEAEISLKVPGNEAVDYQLHPEKLENNYFDYQMCGNDKLPVTVFHRVQERDRPHVVDRPADRCRGRLLQLSSIAAYGLSS